MNRLKFYILSLLVLTCTSSEATVRYVDTNGGPYHYNTIAAAYAASTGGDTLLISQGTYSESLTADRTLTIIGAGFGLTIVNGTFTFNSGASRTVVEGIQISQSGNTVNLGASADSIVIRRCYLHQIGGGSYGFVARCINRAATPGGRIFVDDCLLKNEGNSGSATQFHIFTLQNDSVIVRNSVFAQVNFSGDAVAIEGTPKSLVLQNCVFLGYGTLFDLSGSFPMLFTNNVIYDWTGTPNWGLYPSNSSWQYNASSGGLPPGDNGILLAASPFVNYSTTNNYVYGTSDLHLPAGSPCIDAGQPPIHDLDGTTSDLGIYGGQTPYIDTGAPAYPFTSSLSVPGAITVGQQLQIQSQGRIGRAY